MNEVVKYQTEQGDVELSTSTIKQYLVSGNGKVTDQEVLMFLNLCKYQKLNPFLREAYLIKFGDQPATIVTGKEVFTKRAAKKPEYDGSDAGIIVRKGDEILYRPGTMSTKEETLIGGWAEVYRKDWKRPVRSEVSLDEYQRFKKDGSLMPNWKSMPATMIRKVALVQALREAFPEDLGGMYSQEEMPVDDSKLETKAIDVAPVEVVKESDPIVESFMAQDLDEVSGPINVTPTKKEVYRCSNPDCGMKISENVYNYDPRHLCMKCQKAPGGNQ